MTRRRLIIVIAFLLPPLLFLGILVYLLSDTGLNTVVRPHLERYLGEQMEGEVRLGRIFLGRDRLEISDITLDLPSLRLNAERLEADFLLSDLFSRRLAALRVTAPDIVLTESEEEGGGLPERPPVTVERVEIVGGRLTLHAAGRTWSVDELHLQGRLDEETPFFLSARVGAAPGLPLATHGRLSWGRAPSVTLDSAKLEGDELLTSPLVVTLPAEGAGAEGGIAIERFDEVQLGRILAVLEIDSPLPPEGRFVLEGVRFSFAWMDERLRVAVTARSFTGGAGDFDLFARDLRLQGEGAGDLWEGEGEMLLADQAPLRLSGRLADGEAQGSFTIRSADPAALLEALAGGDWPKVSGGIEGEGEFSASEGGLRVKAALAGTPAPRMQSDLPDISDLAAELLFRSEGEAYSGEATFRLRGRTVVRAAGDLQGMTVQLHPVDAREILPLLPAEMRSGIPEGAERIAGTAHLRPEHDGWDAQIEATAARVPLPPALLEEVRIKGRFARQGEKTILRGGDLSARVSGEEIPSAVLSASGRAEVEGERFRIALDRFSAEGIEYISPDGHSGISGAAVRGRGAAEGRFGAPVSLDLHLEADGGEVLHGAFYADLSSLPAQLRLQGRYDPESQRLEAQRLSATLPEVGEAELRGTLDPVRIDLAATVSLPDLRRGRERLEVLGESFPVVRQTALAGGLGLEARFRRDEEGWRLQGSAEPRGLDLRMEAARFHLSGLSGVLPFDLGSDAGAGEERYGNLSLARLAYGAAELRAQQLRVRSAPGRFDFVDPLVFAIAGGEVEIAGAKAELSEGAPGFSAVLLVRNVDLGELTRELGTVELAGGLSADLGRIEYRGGTLTTDGEMKIDAFGGRFRVRNLRLESLFTSYMTSSLDVDFTGVDLRLVTAAFEFGEVNGIADGYIHELRLFGAVPSHFEASFETRTRGQRNISVAAVRNITTISQGGLAGVLSRGIYRFIDFYRYRKIGLHCTLRNDVFVLTGTARDGDERYLVDGGLLPPKINIIAPEHAISFKEMINRLQRIDRTGGAGRN